ncbi:MAG: hypothetical protein NC920_01260 [Candidatus Omnitrophica bacterium]|nr:hypothetical protein [Candidatus Omnitrophota bacterium]
MVKLKIIPELIRLLKIIGRECAKLKINAYLVGGPVRDLFLGKANIDLDIVLDKDVKTVLPSLAKLLSAKYIYHPQFKTAKLFLDSLYIDIATAREEIYPCLGSLPRVFPTTDIKKDLFRRDFSINAMAIKICEGGLGELLDPYNGWEDLRKGKIRVLHEKSFLDDPTRIIRAIRFCVRLDFTLEKNTRLWLKKAVSRRVFSQISSARLGNEIFKLLQEKNLLAGIKKLRDLCGLKIIHPQIIFNRRWERYFPEVSKWSRDFVQKTSQKVEEWLIYFIFLTEKLDKDALQELCDKYELGKNNRLLVMHTYELKRIEEAKLHNSKYSQLFNLLKPIFPETIIFLIARLENKSLQKKLFEFLVRCSQIRLYTNGERLKKLGFSPGPIFNKILATLFLAKLDGKISTQSEEENFIKETFLR